MIGQMIRPVGHCHSPPHKIDHLLQVPQILKLIIAMVRQSQKSVLTWHIIIIPFHDS